jgi:hypothetical protein
LKRCARGSSAAARTGICSVLLQVHLPEGWHPRGDDQLCQPPNEARAQQRLHPGDTDQLEQRLAQGVVLLAERPRTCTSGVHQVLHREVAEELGGRPSQEGAGEDAEVSLGRVGTPAKRRDHHGGSGRAVPCPRSRAAPEVASPPLRHDC